MNVPLTHHRFTVDDYYRMAEVGILAHDARVELIDGEIVWMSPIGGPHFECVTVLADLLSQVAGNAALVSQQNPVRLNNLSEPQPDIALIQRRRYGGRLPTPDDVFLLIEVSDTTLLRDRNVKVPLYAQSGIPEVWLVDVNTHEVVRFWEPREGSYQQQEQYLPGQQIHVIALPDVSINVADIFE